MLTQFSSYVRAEGDGKRATRVVLLGDHFPAADESVRKRHWKGTRKFIEAWATSTASGPDQLRRLILTEAGVPSMVRKTDPPEASEGSTASTRRVEAAYKAKFSVLSEHLSHKLASVALGCIADGQDPNKQSKVDFKSGDRVFVQGLRSAPQFNGAAGVVRGMSTNGRLLVAMDGKEKPFSLHPGNLRPHTAETDAKLPKKSSKQERKATPASDSAAPEAASRSVHVDTCDTFDFCYLGAFLVLAITFWRSLGAETTVTEDQDQAARLAQYSHDVTWTSLFRQAREIMALGRRRVDDKAVPKVVRNAFQPWVKQVQETLELGRAFVRRHVLQKDAKGGAGGSEETESVKERYNFGFFRAVEADGDQSLITWSAFADRLSAAARSIVVADRVISTLNGGSADHVVIAVEQNVALSILPIIRGLGFECCNFTGSLVSMMPNHPPPSAIKFDNHFFKQVLTKAFQMSPAPDGQADTTDKKKGSRKNKKKKKGRRGRR